MLAVHDSGRVAPKSPGRPGARAEQKAQPYAKAGIYRQRVRSSVLLTSITGLKRCLIPGSNPAGMAIGPRPYLACEGGQDLDNRP
jgi:hypothetical protein